MKSFLNSTDTIDWMQKSVRNLASSLAEGCPNDSCTAEACFNWVRDEIRHSLDYGLNPVTCRASEVLLHRTGFCYAKSHLLAALLRANQIPAGLCYQRVSSDDSGTSFCIHGFNAVYLKETGWYRMDARGNKEGISTSFNPPKESLAFQPSHTEEFVVDRIYPDPLKEVINTLTQYQSVEETAKHLPDFEPPLIPIR